MFPQLNPIPRQQMVTDTFRGYYHRASVPDGMWYETENLTADDYPAMATRRPRGIMGQTTAPHGMIAKDALAYIDGTTLYYNGLACTFNPGVMIDGSVLLPKKIVGMGAYIIIFPDCVYYNTVDSSDNGYLFASFDTDSSVSVAPCRMDGSVYEDITAGATAPTNPANGALWLDTSDETHALKQYSATQEQWVTIPTVYTRIEAANIGAQFSMYDGVQISGLAYSGGSGSMAAQVEALNGSHVLYDVGSNYIVVSGLIDQAATISGGIDVKRMVPDMDFVVESGNRLWGCKYGFQGGTKVVNELYACKLGDPKNWECYMGLSTDSYRVSLGSDGQFTGAITYQGYPTFFKENVIHRVYGTAPSSFQIVTQEFRGVQRGSDRSLAVVGQTLYYKSRTDVCAYDGSAPVSVSDALGDGAYCDAVAGAWGEKYVVSMKDENNAWSLFTYDTRGGTWMREDATRLLYTADVGEELYCIDSGNQLLCVGGTAGTKESKVAWSCVSGQMHYSYKHKRLARYNIRAQIANYASLSVWFEYDSRGGWMHAGTVRGTGLTKTVHFFVVPHRCDHLRMKIEGTNTAKIFAISRVLEEASDL